jgi:hypothetical protein
MANENKDNVEIEPISDAELEGVAGGASTGFGLNSGLDGSSNGCCTCSGDNCSLAEPNQPPAVG